MIIKTVQDLDDVLKNGPYAWPGGYPLYFITHDGAVLSFKTVLKEYDIIADAIANRDKTGGWTIYGVEVNYEDENLYDDHTGEKIESAYGNDK